MTGVAVFDWAAWSARYPELAVWVTQPQAQAYWTEGATVYLDNTACSPVQDVTVRTVLLNMIAAHICKLNAFINGQPPSQLVGRISSASEGSVSVQTQMTAQSGSAEWFQQTSYGAAYWQASLPYRSATYVPGTVRDMDPYIDGAFYVT